MKEIKVKPRGVDHAEIVTLIKTTALIGAGTVDDPCRYVYQYWDLEGKLVAKYDENIDRNMKEELK